MSGTLRAMAALLPAAALAAPATNAEVLHAAQAAVQHDLQRPLRLQPGTVHVAGGWGFVLAELRAPGGGTLDLAGTRLADAAREGFASRQVALLLVQRGGRWQVVEQRLGVTDVAWEGWAERHGAPPSLFVLP